MENKELSDYVKQSRAAGVPDSDIRATLKGVGWSPLDVDQELGMQTAAPSGSRKFKLLGAAIAILILIIAGGGIFYAKAFNTPQKVWNKFSLQSIINANRISQHVEATFKYTDKYQDQDLVGTVVTKADYDRTENQPDKSQSFVTFTGSSGALEYSVKDLETRQLENAIYINVKNIPFVSEMAKDYDGWLKIDLTALKADKNSGAWDKITQKAKDLFNAHPVVSNHKYIGSETINGEKTFHYHLEIDKDSIVSNINELIDSAEVNATSDAGVTDAQKTQAKNTVKALMDNTTFSSSDVWLATNSQLRKINFAIDMPSFVNAALTSATGKANDAKRAADARQIMTALEVYYNDLGEYPKDLNVLMPMYIGTIPTPPADDTGLCGDRNVYKYTLVSPQQYKLDFCLTSTVGSLGAGIGEVSPTGINIIEPHDEWNNDPSNFEAISKQLSQAPKAHMELNVLLSNSTAPVKVEAPEKSYDIYKEMNQNGYY